MKLKAFYFCLAGALIGISSCSTQYEVTSVSRSRILIDSLYDRNPDKAATEFIAPYKAVVDSVMSPVMGHLARNMSGERPESTLSNLLADIMVWAGRNYGENPVLGVYNMGGIRASLSEGVVTYGDILEVAPFENRICFLTLKGDKLTELFEQMASVYGEGVSKGVEMVITKDAKLKSVRLNGMPIDPEKEYRIATIDYLAEGNDRLEAFKSKTNLVAPEGEEHDSRYVICNYFRAMEKEGKVVDSKIEGRVIVEGYEKE